MKTSELTGVALDWAVAKCEGAEYKEGFLFWYDHEGAKRQIKPYPYSSDWAQGGPIIERAGICINSDVEGAGEDWVAHLPGGRAVNGPTPLVAAMRCFVASKLGPEVEIPKDITE